MNVPDIFKEDIMDALKLISQGCLKADAPKVEIGDTVRVQVRIKEGEKSRLQAFEGTVIAKIGRAHV